MGSAEERVEDHGPLVPFDEAARRALAAELPRDGLRGLATALEEAIVDAFAPKLRG